MKSIIWVRDGAARDLLEGYGREHGWETRTVDGHADLLEKVGGLTGGLVFVEYPNFFFTGEEKLLEFVAAHPAIAVVAMLDPRQCKNVSGLLDGGVADCLLGEVDGQLLDASTKRVVEKLERKLRELRVKEGRLRRFMGLVGIERPISPLGRTRVHPRFWIVLSVSILAFLGGSFGFLEYSTSPTFCNSCHIMEPFVLAWKNSTHKDIGCVDCHYPPGQYWKTKFQAISQVAAWMTGTYSTKPYAEIDDANCLACHTNRLLEGEVIFKRGIKFDHVPHLEQLRRGKKLKCTTCHSQIVQGEHVAVNERVCFICHFMGEVGGIEPQTQEFCTKCHQPPPDDIELAGMSYNHKDFVERGVQCQRCHLEAVKGDGAVSQHACYTCHGEPERLAKSGDDQFLHLKHVTEHKVECDQCHSEIIHKVKTQTDPLEYDCKVCHTSMHIGIKKMYMGSGGKGVEDKPSPMYLAQVDCIGCHMQPEQAEDHVVDFGEKTLQPAEKGCTDCHGSDYEGLLQMWLDDVAADLGKTSYLVEAASAALASTGDTQKAKEAKPLVEEAAYDYHFVKTFHGAHNADYSASLLSKAREDSTKAFEILGVPPPAAPAHSE